MDSFLSGGRNLHWYLNNHHHAASLTVDIGLLEQSIASSDGQFLGQSALWLAFHTLWSIIDQVQAWVWWMWWCAHAFAWPAGLNEMGSKQNGNWTELHLQCGGDRMANSRSHVPFLWNRMEWKRQHFYVSYCMWFFMVLSRRDVSIIPSFSSSGLSTTLLWHAFLLRWFFTLNRLLGSPSCTAWIPCKYCMHY